MAHSTVAQAPGRTVGITEILAALLSDPVVVLSALVTQLGDPWFYFVVLTGLYFLAGSTPAIDRDRAAFLVALTVGVVAFTSGLKHLFAYPRPPTPEAVPGIGLVPTPLHPLYLGAVVADGFGFPSGHALGTAAIWPGTALIVDLWERRWRLLTAGAVVLAVSFSRLVLGVHYLVDVVGGAVLGAAYLAVAYRLAEGGRRPDRAFDLAVVTAAFCLLASGIGFESAAILGAALGGWATWRTAGERVGERALARRETAAGLAALAVAGGAFGVVYLLEPIAPVASVGGAIVVASVLGAPLLGREVAGDETGDREPTSS
jgi:membrane-associated phospholipid phosphatase